jgi:hypothetical protein
LILPSGFLLALSRISVAKNQALGAPAPWELPLPELDDELEELLLELDDEPLELELDEDDEEDELLELEELDDELLELELLDDDEDPATTRNSVTTLYGATPVAPEMLVVFTPPTKVAKVSQPP